MFFAPRVENREGVKRSGMNRVQERIKGRRGKYLILTSGIVLSMLLLVVFVFFHGRATSTRTDVSFEWLVEPIYEEAWPFQDGIAWVETEKMRFWRLIDREGKIVKDDVEAVRIFPYTKEGLALVWHPRRKGKRKEKDILNFILRTRSSFLNQSGDIVTPSYNEARPFSGGLASVRSGDSYGFIDTEGNLAIPFQYEWAGGFVGDLGGVGKDGKYGFINKKGETVVDFVFDIPSLDVPPYYPRHELQAVRKGCMRGLLNERGEWVAEPKYERLYCGEDSLVGLQKDGKVGFVNLSGDIVIDFQFMGIPVYSNSDHPGSGSLPYCYRFSEGRAIVLMPPKWGSSDWYSGYGVIDTEGKLLFTFDANPYGLYSEGFLVVQNSKEKRAGLFDKEGNWIPLPDEVCFLFPSAMSEVRGGILNVLTSKSKKMVDFSKTRGDFKAGYLKVIKEDEKR